MSYEQILYETRGDVAIITLNRPTRLNAWTRKMSAEMTDAMRSANADKSVGAVVFTGAGRGFCAGADIESQFKAQLDKAHPASLLSTAPRWVLGSRCCCRWTSCWRPRAPSCPAGS